MKTCEMCGGYGKHNHSCPFCSEDPFDQALVEVMNEDLDAVSEVEC